MFVSVELRWDGAPARPRALFSEPRRKPGRTEMFPAFVTVSRIRCGPPGAGALPQRWRSSSREFHRLAGARGFVNRRHDFHIPPALFPRNFRRLVIQDALREIIHLGGEL